MAMLSFQQRLRNANSHRLELTRYTSPALYRLIAANADAIGAPEEFIFYPLLTAVASCMGVNGYVRINDSWTEPSILWLIVAAKKGEKKTAALRIIRKPIEQLETTLREQWASEESETKPKTPPQLLVDNFSFEELHAVMKRNNNQILGFFDEMSSFYSQLDLFKHSGTILLCHQLM